MAQAQFIGALAGFLFSQGDGENVSLAGTIARSAFENNYLTHEELKAFLEELKACDENYNDCAISDLLKKYQEISQENSDDLKNCELDSACVAGHLDKISEAYELAEVHLFGDNPDFTIAPLAILQGRDMRLAIQQMVRIKYLEGACPGLGNACIERVEAEEWDDFLTDIMPVIGDGKAFYEAYQSGEIVDWGVAIVALVPLLGDAIKRGVKASKLSKLIDDMPDDWTIDKDTGKIFDNDGFEVTIQVDDAGNPSWGRVDDTKIIDGGDTKPDTPDTAGDELIPDNGSIGFATTRSDFDSEFPESSFPATKDHTSKELQESAWKVYQDTSQGTKPIIMGRLDDTAAGADLGFQRLDTDKWSIEVNDAWVQGGVDARKDFYLGAPETSNNLWDAVNNRPTVMAREIQQLKNAGYVKQGDYYAHPSRVKVE